MTTISLLGLGLMGRPMARRLAARGFNVVGWNRSALPPDRTEGIPVAYTLAEAARSDVCLLMLADSEAVDAVLTQLEPYLRAGQLVIDMGSSDPVRSRIHSQRLERSGIGWVDAPVSGGPEGAEAGNLAIMAGGSGRDVVRARPLLEALGGNVVHVGGPGAGHTVKIINQVIVGLTIEAVAEALLLAERSGIDPALVQQALRGGFADSKVLQIHGTRMRDRAYVPGGKVKTHLKDLRMALSLAQSAGLALPHTESTAVFFEALVARGEGDLDHAALHKRLLDEAR